MLVGLKIEQKYINKTFHLYLFAFAGAMTISYDNKIEKIIDHSNNNNNIYKFN